MTYNYLKMDEVPTDQIPTQDQISQTPPADFQEGLSFVDKLKIQVTKLTERPALLVLVVGVVLLSSIAGVFTYRDYQLRKQAEQSERAVEAPTPIPTPRGKVETTPTPTEAPQQEAAVEEEEVTEEPTSEQVVPTETPAVEKKSPNTYVGYGFGIYIPTNWTKVIFNSTKEYFVGRFLSPSSNEELSYVDIEVIPSDELIDNSLIEIQSSENKKMNGLDAILAEGKETFDLSARLASRVAIKAQNQYLVATLFRDPSDTGIKNEFDLMIQSVMYSSGSIPTSWQTQTPTQTYGIMFAYTKFRSGAERVSQLKEIIRVGGKDLGGCKVGEREVSAFLVQFAEPVKVVGSDTLKYDDAGEEPVRIDVCFSELGSAESVKDVSCLAPLWCRPKDDPSGSWRVENKLTQLSPTKVLFEPVEWDGRSFTSFPKIYHISGRVSYDSSGFNIFNILTVNP